MALAGLASAAIDLSDGLAQDLGHLLRASGVGARIHYADIPAFEESAAFDEDQRRQCVLAGGDDYELCWTVAPGRLDACRETGACHRIGTVEAEPGLRIVDESGALIIAPHGFRHFST